MDYGWHGNWKNIHMYLRPHVSWNEVEVWNTAFVHVEVGEGTKCTGGLEKNLLPSARRQRRMLLIPELVGEKKGAPVNSLRVNRRTITCTLQCIILGEFEGCHWLQRHFLRKDALLGVDSLSWFTSENKKSSSTCQKKGQAQNSYQFYKKISIGS